MKKTAIFGICVISFILCSCSKGGTDSKVQYTNPVDNVLNNQISTTDSNNNDNEFEIPPATTEETEDIK